MMQCSGLAVGRLGRCIRSSNPQLADETRHRAAKLTGELSKDAVRH
jgi:hypothetical protein